MRKPAHIYSAFNLNILSRLSLHVRRRIFGLFMDTFRPGPETTVLDIGVMGNAREEEIETNYFERLYPWPEKVYGLTMDDPALLQKKFSRSRFTKGDGRDIPFPDKSFDIVFSGAVIEHVGSREKQRLFVREACRVGKNVFIATPNKYFPIEAHSHLPFINYLPDPLFRKILRICGMKELSSEENLNLLNAQAFKELFDPALDPRVVRIRLGGITQNLVAIVQQKS